MLQQSPFPNYTIARWLLISLAVGLLSLFLWDIRNILLYALMAIILVIFIGIPVERLENLGVKRLVAILITFVGGMIIVYILALVVLPTLIDQFVLLGDVISQGLKKVVEDWNSGKIQEDIPLLKNVDVLNLNEEIQLDVETIRGVGEQVLSTLGSLGGSVLPFLGGLANTFLSFLIVFFLTMFFLAEPDKYKKGLIVMFPLWYRYRVREILDRLHILIRRWIYAQLIAMMITGFGTYIGLMLIGIEQAAALAVLTALFSFVPNFGELSAAGVALAVAAVQTPDRLLWVVVVIYGVSFIQGQIFGPLITSESVNIPPVIILLGQVVVAGFFGVTGIVLAVPIMAIVMVVIQEVYIKDILGDRYDESEASDNDVSGELDDLVPDGV